MCIRDRDPARQGVHAELVDHEAVDGVGDADAVDQDDRVDPVSYTHLRAHETVLDLVCRLLLEKKKTGAYQHNKRKKNRNNITVSSTPSDNATTAANNK